MATLSQIRTKVRTDIGQSTASTSDFDDTELNGFINEGTRYIGALVKKPTDHFDWQAENDKEGYTLPTDALLILGAYFGDSSIQGDVRPLDILTEESLRSVNPFWMDRTSSSKGRPQRIILYDAQTVVVDPRPDTDSGASGKKIIVNYCYQPASLSSDSDTPGIPIVFHDLISEYAQYKCYMSAKINKPEEGLAIFKTLATKAKQLEPLAVKEQLNSGFSWGTQIGDDDDGLLSSYRL